MKGNVKIRIPFFWIGVTCVLAYFFGLLGAGIGFILWGMMAAVELNKRGQAH